MTRGGVKFEGAPTLKFTNNAAATQPELDRPSHGERIKRLIFANERKESYFAHKEQQAKKDLPLRTPAGGMETPYSNRKKGGPRRASLGRSHTAARKMRD